MNLHQKKMIAPIIVSILVVLYYVAYFAILITLIDGIWKVLLGVIPLGFSILVIRACMDRIKEITRGEEDDISKY